MVPTPSVGLPHDAENGGGRHADPTCVVTDFFAALALQDWEDAVRYVEPRSLAEFRESQLAMLAAWAAHRDELRRARGDRNTYIAVTKNVLDSEMLERHGDVRLHAFAGGPTLLEVAALPAETFAMRFLAASRMAPSAYRVFGHVLESDDVAHVVYRPIGEALQRERLDVAVLHLRRHEGMWQVLLSPELADGTFILFHLDQPVETEDDA